MLELRISRVPWLPPEWILQVGLVIVTKKFREPVCGPDPGGLRTGLHFISTFFVLFFDPVFRTSKYFTDILY